ncbi:neuropeptide FF receptor 2-like [Branchiostoma floridae x Branchiostoma belcheri]
MADIFEFLDNSTRSDSNQTADVNWTISTATRLKQSVPVIALFGVSYFLIFALCLVGNTLVCFVVIKIPRMRTVTNYFILNLAVSDLLVGIFCMPFTLVDNIVLGWPFGDAMCRLVPFMQTTSVIASVFTLLAIAVDRFYAVVLPMKPKLTVSQMAKAVTAIWVFAVSISLPLIIFNHDKEYPDQVGNVVYLVHHCQEQFPGVDVSKYYSLSLFVLCYLVPLGIILVLYVLIGHRIWFKATPGGQKASMEAQNIALQKKRKVVKMLIVVVVVFALFWLPLHTTLLLNDFVVQLTDVQKQIMYIYIFPIAHWLSYFNSSVNPIIYGYFNPNFRDAFKSLFSRKDGKGSASTAQSRISRCS